MIVKSLRTSELYIVAFVLLVWGVDRLGIDVGQLLALLLDLRTTSADVARELQGLEEPRGSAGYWLAALWVAARTALKVRLPGSPYQPVSPAAGSAPADRRHDPYRAWYTPEPTVARPDGAVPDKPAPPPPEA
ncbi:MAG: hypothetical protein RBS34_02815 [Desulfofustis sp.]|jgi:hypothetical protein|nr:hypothetical protein [Desulfofustis sp.]